MNKKGGFFGEESKMREENKIDWKVGLEKSLNNKPESLPLIALATNGEIMKYQGEVPAERYEIQGRYRNGAHSVIYKARDRETGNIVGIKKHLHYIPETDDAEEIRLAEDRFRREAQILAKLNHPGIMDAYGFFFKQEDGVSTPHLVMELIDQESLEESLVKGRTFNEKDARALALSVGTILDYMHTVNGQPIIYRDLKPDNVKVMPKEAEWPHKIVDFSESRIGRSTMSGSVTGTIGYNAPEIYGGRIADQSTDFYSLMRIAAHMLIGDDKKFMASWFGNTSLREMKEDGDLNVSEQFLRAIERATSKDPEKRYNTLVELARDLGYGIERAPQNREELERVLEHESLPARIESPEVKEVGRTVKVKEYFVEEGNANILINGFAIKKEKNVYEMLKGIRSSFKNRYFEAAAASIIGPQIDLSTFAYLQHAAKEHPILQDVIDGKLTLEGMLRKKGPSLFNYILSDTETASKYYLSKQQYNQRHTELLKVFGGHELDFQPYNLGMIFGGMGGTIGTPLALGLLLSQFISKPFWSFKELVINFVGGAVLGGTIGSRIYRAYHKRKLLKQAREIDSWVREARVSQGLERRVEEHEMKEIANIKIEDGNMGVISVKNQKFKKRLREIGLKKKFLRNKFVGEGIEVYYKNNYYGRDEGYADTTFKVRAVSEERAEPVLEVLRGFPFAEHLGLSPGEILTDGTKVLYSQHNVGLEKESMPILKEKIIEDKLFKGKGHSITN